MSIWSNNPKKSELPKRTTIKFENDLIVVQTYLTKEEAISIREGVRDSYRNIPKLNKDLFEQCWYEFVENEFDDCIAETVQGLADESDEPSTFESW